LICGTAGRASDGRTLVLDPVTAVATASAAFNGIKKLISAGREIEDVMGQMATWAGAASDLAYHANEKKSPPLFKKLTSGKSVEQEAMEIFAHKRKIEAQEKELREIILYAYGQEAWRELIGLRRRIKLEREQAFYAQQRKRKAYLWNTITAVILTVLCYGFYAGMSFFIKQMKGE